MGGSAVAEASAFAISLRCASASAVLRRDRTARQKASADGRHAETLKVLKDWMARGE
jgi:hypothetical protein